MQRKFISSLILSLLTVSLFVGPGLAQGPDEKSNCDPGDGPDDPDWWNTQTGIPPAAICDADTSRKDDVPPDQPGDLAFSAIHLNGFTMSWTEPHDLDNEDVSDDESPRRDYGEGNGTAISKYIVYNHTQPFTDLDDAFASREVVQGEDDDAVPTSYTFADLAHGTTMYVAVTAVDSGDDGGNEGDPTFGTVVLPDAQLVLWESTVSYSEDVRKFEYNITVNGEIAEGTSVSLNVTLIDNVDLDVEPIEVTVEHIVLTPEEPLAEIRVNVTDDDFGLGDRTYIIKHSINTTAENQDPDFVDVADADLTVNILEDEVEPAINMVGGVQAELTEGTADNVTVLIDLAREPTDDVFLKVSLSNDTRVALASDHFLHFGRADWDIPQSVIIWAPDNAVIDGDRTFTVNIDMVDDETAPEYVERATDRSFKIRILDDEVDADEDAILDSVDKDPENRFNKDFRPNELEHTLADDGQSVTFTWTARHLDDRIEHYAIYEFSDPEKVETVEVVEGQRDYEVTVDFDDESVHTYGIMPVLKGHDLDEEGNYTYDEEATVPLSAYVFTREYFESVCPAGADDEDEDGVCDDFEDLIGTDEDEADTDGDGRDDGKELLTHGTDPNDPNSHYTFIPSWGRNPWLIIGSVLVLASIVLAIVSFARSGDNRRPARS